MPRAPDPHAPRKPRRPHEPKLRRLTITIDAGDRTCTASCEYFKHAERVECLLFGDDLPQAANGAWRRCSECLYSEQRAARVVSDAKKGGAPGAPTMARLAPLPVRALSGMTALTLTDLDAIQQAAKTLNADFYTFLGAMIGGKGYAAVQPEERAAMKNLLFAHAYNSAPSLDPETPGKGGVLR